VTNRSSWIWGCAGILALLLLQAPVFAEEKTPASESQPAAYAPHAAASEESQATEAVAVVERLHAVLIEVMKEAESLGYQGRYDRLSPALQEFFDLPFMAEKSVGRHWKTTSPEDQKILVQTFVRYSIANYAGRFHGYSGQHFETLGEEPAARGTRLVRTQLIDPNDENVKLDYRLRATDGDWKIVDVYLNGTVSELALRRSEYSSLIKREGLEALLAALDERIENLASAPADE
jgi:phospholipid transport system substrate-binding protein